MKAFITIELEVTFTDEQTKELDKALKKENMTFKYHATEIFTDLLIKDADMKPEFIKSIEINRVD